MTGTAFMRQPESFRVIVAGSRSINTPTQYQMVCRMLDEILKNRRKVQPVVIISGGADGPDTMAVHYAKCRNLAYRIYEANWKRDGRSAGMKRNAVMLRNADAVVCFWDGKSRGTANMIEITKAAGLPLRIVRTDKASLIEVG